ncbi:MAG: RHS repeat-associated core domain-containing protein, partial [Ruminococcaceae bacterium]|nr:RHS repeat-associated core domain-containing protein [Oscillospiraceae bacterium]
MRTAKNGITYEYHGDKLRKEIRNGDIIEYIDGIDGLIGFIYNGTPYYYVKNIFGDVTKIVNKQNIV